MKEKDNALFGRIFIAVIAAVVLGVTAYVLIPWVSIIPGLQPDTDTFSNVFQESGYHISEESIDMHGITTSVKATHGDSFAVMYPCVNEYYARSVYGLIATQRMAECESTNTSVYSTHTNTWNGRTKTGTYVRVDHKGAYTIYSECPVDQQKELDFIIDKVL